MEKLGIDWVSQAISAGVTAVFTVFGVWLALYIDRHKKRKNNRKRWARWHSSKRSSSPDTFAPAPYSSLIYEIKDWAGTVEVSFASGSNASELEKILAQYGRKMHLETIRCFLSMHAFPDEIEIDIVDLLVDVEYFEEEVASFIAGTQASDANTLAIFAASIRQDAQAIIRKGQGYPKNRLKSPVG